MISCGSKMFCKNLLLNLKSDNLKILSRKMLRKKKMRQQQRPTVKLNRLKKRQKS
jgi:hypothetical protein